MSKARILIVEDEQIVALDIQGTLESRGYTIVGQTNKGDDAILKAAELKPDLILMDIGLKGEMDGIEAAAQIRARFDLPVIFLTAFANQSTLERAREAEPFGYVLKPFEEHDLIINIEMALYKHGIEYKLRESESKFRLLVESMDDIIFTLDTEQCHTGVFGSWVEQSGMTADMFLGKTVREILGDRNSALHEAMNQRAISGEIVAYEWSGGTQENPMYVYTKLSPIKDPSGKILGIVGVGRNITERKILEQAEQEQRRLAEALRDTSSALSSTLESEEVLDRILHNIGKLTPYDAAMVLLIEGHKVRKIRHHSQTHSESINLPPIGDTTANLINVPILSEMIETGQPCLIPDTQTDSRWRAIPGLGWIRSFISAPIQIRGQVAGLINVISAEPGFFTQKQSERLMAFAGQAAIAIENAQLFERAQYLAMTDPLTEMNNRRYFFDIARLEFERIQRTKRTLSILMMDIDRFKNINDTFGHSVGDLVLREVAARIKSSVRSVDIVARYGGEEFIVLMPETGLDVACQIAERIRRSIADSPFEEEAVTATLSIGAAEIDEKSKNVDQLIIYADKALYNAKAAGRNRVEGYQNA